MNKIPEFEEPDDFDFFVEFVPIVVAFVGRAGLPPLRGRSRERT